MHPNPAFRGETPARNLAFARQRGFGVLAVSDDRGPLISHVPFLLNEAGTQAHLHLVRSNPIARLLDDPCPAVIAVSGPDGYISPDWYGLPDQVPTWNYVAVHLRGTLRRLPDEALRPILDAVSDHFEDGLAPKPPWRTAKMDPNAMDRMMRAIVPIRLDIDTVDGTWKLGQNKPEDARLGAAEGVGNGTAGQDTQALARLMREPPSAK
ncbi:MAG: FMN-binding negative transcriptional regulator [Paracoccaceae bacterium]